MTKQQDKDNDFWQKEGSESRLLDRLATRLNPFLSETNRAGYENGVANPPSRPSLWDSEPSSTPPEAELTPTPSGPASAVLESSGPPDDPADSFDDDDDDYRFRNRFDEEADEVEEEPKGPEPLSAIHVFGSGIQLIEIPFSTEEEKQRYIRQQDYLTEEFDEDLLAPYEEYAYGEGDRDILKIANHYYLATAAGRRGEPLFRSRNEKKEFARKFKVIAATSRFDIGKRIDELNKMTSEELGEIFTEIISDDDNARIWGVVRFALSGVAAFSINGPN